MSDEKPQRPKRTVKPKAEAGEFKGERQKAKGENKKKTVVSGHRPVSIKPKGEGTQKYSESVPNSEIQHPKSETNHDSAIHIPHSEITPSKSEIEHPTSEINNASEIEYPTSEINMEVHHHPQLDHNPKPIKEYLLEGLMIFIAVMMGFVAENVREYISDNEHVHQLCAQFARDLKTDTTNLTEISYHIGIIARQNDFLFNILQQPVASVDTREMLRLAGASNSMWPFHPTGGATEAIKNELHLKQFSSSDIISHIATYEGHIQLLHIAQDITLQYQHLYLDPFMLQHFSPRDVDGVYNQRLGGHVQVRNLTQADMTQMADEMALIHVNTDEQARHCDSLKKDATALLQYVQKHFDVGDK